MLRTGRPRNRGSTPNMGKTVFSIASRSQLGAHPASCSMGTKEFKSQVMNVTNHLSLVPRLGKSCAIPSLLHIPPPRHPKSKVLQLAHLTLLSSYSFLYFKGTGSPKLFIVLKEINW